MPFGFDVVTGDIPAPVALSYHQQFGMERTIENLKFLNVSWFKLGLADHSLLVQGTKNRCK